MTEVSTRDWARLSSRATIIRGSAGASRPMSYTLPDPCEHCWLVLGRVVPLGMVLVGSRGSRLPICPHGGAR